MWQHTGRQRPDFAIEPGPGQESVWDYPRPPALVADSRHIVVMRDNDIVADTRKSLRLCETASPPTFYLPPDDVRLDLLLPVSGSSICEWKGAASYFALQSDPDTPVAWSYPRPRARYARLQNFIAFYPALMTCLVDDEQVRPQPGRFYGGWVTSDVVGPFKGESGTGHW